VPKANACKILKYDDGVFSWAKDPVVEECRAEIYVNGQLYVAVMATPAQLDYLTIGYLFTEGAINAVSDIKGIAVNGLSVRAELWSNPPGPPFRARSSGFGSGSVTVKNIQANDLTPVNAEPPTIMAERIIELMGEFNQLSELFWQTGAVHSAWLVRGERRYFSEDVGRHNALDKVIGQSLSDEASSAQTGLIFITGRISTEMVLKAAKAGVAALISRGSASGLAVELAEKINLILIGFSRGNQFKAFWGGQYLSALGSCGNAHE